MGFLDAFLFQPLIKFYGLLLFIAWKWPLEFIIIQNSVRNKRFFANWAVDGAHDAFHENWLH